MAYLYRPRDAAPLRRRTSLPRTKLALSLILAFLAAHAQAADLVLSKVLVGEGFSRPVAVTAVPGDAARLFIAEQHTGRIRILNRATGQTLATPFLTIAGMTTGNEQGLLGLAFHPQYATNGYFYVHVTSSGPSRSDILRYRVTGDPATSNIADPDSRTVILTTPQPESNHNGGWVGFGLDGFLYIAFGDGGGGNDGHGTIGNGQDRTVLLGKILRIDVDGGTPYAIPDGNPYKNHGTFRQEIWAFGLRHPFRCGFDRQTGDLWIGDVGQGAREEVDFIPAGAGGRNFGWRPREGFIATPGVGGTPVTTATDPVIDYTSGVGHAVIGGHVYRGSAFPELQGTYFYADYVSSRMWTLRYDGATVSEAVQRTSQIQPQGPSSFGEDSAGELYFCELGSGDVYRIVIAAPTVEFASASQSVDESAGATSIEVRLSHPSDLTVTVQYAATGGTASGVDDYTLAAGTLTFDPGETSQFIPLTILEDMLDEPAETVHVTLSAPSNAVLGATFHALTIEDNDGPPVFTTTPGLLANVGIEYLYDAQASGTGVVLYELTQHPAGMEVDTLTGEVTWTPTAEGSFPVTLRAYNGVLPDATQSFTLQVSRYGLVARPGADPFLNMPANELGTLPALLSQTGAFDDTAALTPSAALIPFNVNSPLWSDAAIKSRWVSIPTGTTVGFAPTGAWTFPAGTVFVKHFELGIDEADPSVRKRLETRLLMVKADGSVYGVTYKWRADHSDADLLADELDEDVTIQLEGGGSRVQTWSYPSRSACLTCHTPNAGHILGANTRQLNGLFLYPQTGEIDNQLRSWNYIGLFGSPLNEASIPGFAALAAVGDTTASLEHRSRSYLDANCAQCHRPGGAPANFDARFDTALAQQNLIDGPVDNPLGIAFARAVAPASVSRSIVHHRMGLVGANQMPPLARNLPDAAALSVLAAWIDSLPQRDPVVSVPQPADGSWVAGTLNALALAHDPDAGTEEGDGIQQVVFELRQGGSVQATQTAGTPPYTWSFDTTGLPDGNYTLRARAESLADVGGTSAQQDLDVRIFNANQAPTVAIDDPASPPLYLVPGQSFVFGASGGDADAGDAVSFAWDFDDGSFGAGAQAMHAFEAAGEYTVTVTATDRVGASASDAVTVIVSGLVQDADLRIDQALYILNFALAQRIGPQADQLTLKGKLNPAALIAAGLDPAQLAGQALRIECAGVALTAAAPVSSSATKSLWQTPAGAIPNIKFSFAPATGIWSATVKNAALAAALDALGASDESNVTSRLVTIPVLLEIGGAAGWRAQTLLGTRYTCRRAGTSGKGQFKMGGSGSEAPLGAFFVDKLQITQKNAAGGVQQRLQLTALFWPPAGTEYDPTGGAGAEVTLGLYVETVGDGSVGGVTFAAQGATTFTYTRPRNVPGGIALLKFLVSRGQMTLSTNYMDSAGPGVFGIAPVLNAAADARQTEDLRVRIEVGETGGEQTVRLLRKGTSWKR